MSGGLRIRVRSRKSLYFFLFAFLALLDPVLEDLFPFLHLHLIDPGTRVMENLLAVLAPEEVRINARLDEELGCE